MHESTALFFARRLQLLKNSQFVCSINMKGRDLVAKSREPRNLEVTLAALHDKGLNLT